MGIFRQGFTLGRQLLACIFVVLFLVSCASEREKTRAEVAIDLEEAISNVSAGKASILKVELRRSKQVLRLGLPQGALASVELDLFDSAGDKINPNPIVLSPQGEAVKLDLPQKYPKDEAFTVAAAQDWQGERLHSRKVKLINPLFAGTASFMTTQASLNDTTDATLADATATDAASTATTDSASADSTTTTETADSTSTDETTETAAASSEDATTDTASADATSDSTEATTEETATTEGSAEPAAPAEEPLPEFDPAISQETGIIQMSESDWANIEYEDTATQTEVMARTTTVSNKETALNAVQNCKKFVVAYAHMETGMNRYQIDRYQWVVGVKVYYNEHRARIWSETQSYVADACGNRIKANMAASQWVRFNEGDKIMDHTFPTRTVQPASSQHICSTLSNTQLSNDTCNKTFEVPVYSEASLLRTSQEYDKYVGTALQASSLDNPCQGKSHHKFKITVTETVPVAKTNLMPGLNAKGAAPAKPQPAKPQPAKPQPAKPQPAKPQPAKPQPAKPQPVVVQPIKPVQTTTRDKVIAIDLRTDYNDCRMNVGDIEVLMRQIDKVSCAYFIYTAVETGGTSVGYNYGTASGLNSCKNVLEDMKSRPEDYEALRERDLLRRIFPNLFI